MKTILFIAVVFLTTASLSSFTTTAKIENSTTKRVTAFSHFRAHRQGAGIALSWASATEVAGFRIERSYDGEFFETLTQVSANGTATHKYVDENVYPGYIHYRIAAIDGSGAAEYSPVQIVRIVSRK